MSPSDQTKLGLAVLISGSGSNLQAILDACANPDFPARVLVVISNNPEAYGLTRAREAGIPAIIIPHTDYSNRRDFDTAIQNALSNYPVDLICLAGFMRILTPEFIKNWTGRIINTHPSLLPKFGGKGMYGSHVHKAVLNAGEKETGVTIHIVIPEVDKGEIILQKRIDVREDDSVDTLAARVLAREHQAYPEAIGLLAEKLKQK
jgi:phosphoribosylglycinamide formyltransferase 1